MMTTTYRILSPFLQLTTAISTVPLDYFALPQSPSSLSNSSFNSMFTSLPEQLLSLVKAMRADYSIHE